MLYLEPELPREEVIIHNTAFLVRMYTSGDQPMEAKDWPDLISSCELSADVERNF